ncbi:MAG: translation initiation factor [Bacteroidota bacterium]|nr:translation initiation factor [Bacteroidota bacterium]
MSAKLNDLSDLGALFGRTAEDAGEKEKKETPSDRAKSLVKLHVQLEKKGRKGKGVTVIMGFFHMKRDMEDYARDLKARCGAGGTVKGDTIEIQGDHRKTAAEYFRAKGFRVTGG